MIIKINGDAPRNADFRRAAGKTLKLTVKHGSSETKVSMTIGSRTVKDFELVEMPQASAAQLKVREGWLKR